MNTTSGFSFNAQNFAVPSSAATTPSSTVNTPAAGFGGFSMNTGFTMTPNVTITSSSVPTVNLNVNPVLFTSAPSATTASQMAFGSLSLPTSSVGKNTSFSFSSPTSTVTVSAAKTNNLLASNTVTSTAGSLTKSVIGSEADKSINYVQLQDLTNKWFTDFEDLQKILMNQTTETINRDVILASNEDQIEKLVDSVKNLKTEQSQVEQQLDFILSQQKDLEECLASLEDEVSSYFPELPADDMYKLAENIDSRLKKTLETSKEIITKINDKNRSSENITNPMVAIGHILNHHTNSIQMLENLNDEGQAKLNDVQKLYQQFA